MKTLNELIDNYTYQVKQGDIQVAYKGILDYMGKLQRSFANNYEEYEVSSNLYQGYMDMSFISLSTEILKEKGLKIVIVYLHEKGAFEVWLSGRNIKIIKEYKSIFNNAAFDDTAMFHDYGNEDAIIECTLTAEPDFDNQNLLTEIIEKGTERFIAAVTKLL